jgi:hypothetical protein
MVNWLVKPELIKKSPGNLEAFLAAISGLEYCTILLTMNWQLDFKTILDRHGTLKELVISLGKNKMVPGMLTKLVKL